MVNFNLVKQLIYPYLATLILITRVLIFITYNKKNIEKINIYFKNKKQNNLKLNFIAFINHVFKSHFLLLKI